MQGRTAFLFFFYRALMPDAGTVRANVIERLERAGKENRETGIQCRANGRREAG